MRTKLTRLRLLWYRFPVEVSLVVFVTSTFLIQVIDNPSIWFPSTFVPFDEIPNDVLTCPSSKSDAKHDGNNEIYCDLRPPHLKSNFPILNEYNESLVESHANVFGINEGGWYRPKKCEAKVHVNILIPYRRRKHQLNLFLQHIHPFLVGQETISYRIFVIEQADTVPFNRGKLFNIGFVESMKLNPSACCFILHDVDLLPENQFNTYACSKHGPRHMSVAVNTFRYNLLYRNLFGGVVAIKKRDMKLVNGFSNLYYGWGGEDDDLSARIRENSLNIVRWDSKISKYFMLRHKKENASTDRGTLLSESKTRWQNDGLSSLSYRILEIVSMPLFTKIRVTL